MDIAGRWSPNFDTRAGNCAPDMVVIHYTGMETAEAALERLQDAEAKVSAHYLIDEEGRAFALVPEFERAWHAGVSSWHGETDVNSLSIGIEMANKGHEFGYPDFPDAQMTTLLDLMADIFSRWPLDPARVVGHSDVAPGRKADPGEKFPWKQLAEAGFALWVDPAPLVAGPTLGPGDSGDGVRDLQIALSQAGYDINTDGVFSDVTRDVVTAFQRRQRPLGVDGVADLSTLKTLAAFLEVQKASSKVPSTE
ncbi:MAG: N-acetylmuramoyl-L-alanine amidase [Candidatus Phaeomarinobacter sp.]